MTFDQLQVLRSGSGSAKRTAGLNNSIAVGALLGVSVRLHQHGWQYGQTMKSPAKHMSPADGVGKMYRPSVS